MAFAQIDPVAWSPTRRSLHAYAQFLGKLRLALSPAQPNWMFTALVPNARGVTTGAIPYDGTAIEARIDVFSSEIVLSRSTGAERRVPLEPARPVAEVFAAFNEGLKAIGVDVKLTRTPQEVPDTTPFDEDTRPARYDAEIARRWFEIVCATNATFDGWRARFFGRSGIQLWWGAFDFALVLFNGRHATAPTDRGYIMKYDLDAELLNCGLYVGDENTAPYFYGYVYPQPPGAERLRMAPESASWSNDLKEWTLPFDAVRSAPDPVAELHAFLDALYAGAVETAGWDDRALQYDAPK